MQVYLNIMTSSTYMNWALILSIVPRRSQRSVSVTAKDSLKSPRAMYVLIIIRRLHHDHCLNIVDNSLALLRRMF